MPKRTLPPLEVNAVYRVAEFDHFEFTAESLQKAVTGEETAILRLILKNQTVLEVPTSTVSLHFLLRNLMDAYPTVAVEHALTRRWLAEK